ncbi:GntR family transcriptional regulator [Abyssibius alkaniclasticus]|uniref:GntR family transcriptional regulator n=1 Tax=Abyssibius alkaniclasticus TaxID=2881234 RepID=UPI002363B5C3|nr:GntR family transcriptional regulator [Abyssibius alkaniclasticus]UPH71792.1 GntR family transcriptional regulator [Abyssibius alkaniclasticus]|tara:strand:- start:176 stop:931 length:756 start_codon:yes stop_codon:yes gene_type:complete
MIIDQMLAPSRWLRPNGGPRYLQLRRHIEAAIQDGTLAPNSPLPAEREIAAITGLSRVTVRKAVETLVDDGLIVQRRGSGSFVAAKVQRVEQSLSRLTSFTEDMARRGMVVESKWLERGLFMPSPQEVVALGLRGGDSVARIARLRCANGLPMAIERAALSAELLPNPLLVDSSLYAVLERDGNRPVRAIQRISATNLTGNNAALLGVEPGEAGLRIERTSYLPSGRVVEFTQSIYRGDAYDFVAELQISG